jgi:uncharacterized repeat protein (TIGR03803 family)
MSRGSALALAAFAALVLLAIAGTPAHSQTYTVLHSFGSGTDGATPVGVFLPEGIDGEYANDLIGATTYGGASGYGTVFYLDLDSSTGAWTETVAHSFSGADGSYPAVGPNDNLGTTLTGGAYGKGTLYGVSPTSFTPNVYNFCAAVACEDGAYPQGVGLGSGVTRLGITEEGGLYGVGTLFDMDDKTNQEIYSYWLDDGTTGGDPTGQVATYENPSYQTLLYFIAGTGDLCNGGRGNVNVDCGGVFSWNPTTGIESALHLFTSTPDGAQPTGGLTVARPQNYPADLYGTTDYGGAYGWGTVFAVNQAGGGYTIVHSFTGGADGGAPTGSVGILFSEISGAFGYTIYGTAAYGGAAGSGTLWEINHSGVFSVLHSFCSAAGCADGAIPSGPVRVQASPAPVTLFGTTTSGGTYGKGVAFEYVF